MNFVSLEFSSECLERLVSRDFSSRERLQFIKALRLLDTDERHPPLRVHELEGDAQGVWSASASIALRITFRRAESGRKRLPAWSRHYQ